MYHSSKKIPGFIILILKYDNITYLCIEIKRDMKKLELFLAFCWLLCLSGCNVIEYHPYDTRITGETGVNAKNIKLIEERMAGKKTFRFDCSGYVAAVYWASNIAVFEKQAILDSGGVKTIYATLSKYKKIYKNVLPNVGDIIMFDKTTSDTKKLTHAGIVIDVDEKDETVTYIHASTSKGLILGYMNLKYPDLARKDGKIINSYLKRGGGVNALASHCFNSYGTILDIPVK